MIFALFTNPFLGNSNIPRRNIVSVHPACPQFIEPVEINPAQKLICINIRHCLQ
jgi:hypothetical protein